jgi:hypothetical protein
MFVRDSHHENVTIVITLQNYFGNNQNIMRNAQYRVLFRDPIDDYTLRTISSQLKFSSVKGKSFLVACFEALAAYYPDWKYPYVVINSNPTVAADWMRITTKIFPEPGEQPRQNFVACIVPNPRALEK